MTFGGAQRRHAANYAAVAERAREQIEGPGSWPPWTGWRPSTTTCGPRWPGRWKPRPPTGRPSTQGERAVIGLRLVHALAPFWYQHGHATEGRRWLQRAMDMASGDGAPLAQVAHGLGVLLDQQGEPDAARRMFERSLAIWRKLGDREEQARELNSLGITLLTSARCYVGVPS